jgi:hypothetical protein
VPLEDAAEKSDVLIAHRFTDLLHVAMVAFEQTFGGGNAQLLQVAQRTVSRSFALRWNRLVGG